MTLNLCVMLTYYTSTELCKTVDRFLQRKLPTDLSTLFHRVLVEKPVENVENYCGKVIAVDENSELCRLIFSEASFFHRDICFPVNTLKTIRLFVKNIENTPLLLGKLMVSSKGWRKNQLSTNP